MHGYILTRHVNSQETDAYWKECYACIRNIDPEAPILIVDDKSSPEFLSTLETTNCEIVNSEYPGAGEILSYYYFWKLRPFDKAIVIHDSVFVHTKIDVDQIESVKFLWHFDHAWNTARSECFFLGKLKGGHELVNAYDRHHEWWGYFGIQSVITLDFLDKLVQKYDLFNLLPVTTERFHRCCLERVFALICTLEEPKLQTQPSFFGLIHMWQRWEYRYSEYLKAKQEKRLPRPVIKVWTGR